MSKQAVIGLAIVVTGLLVLLNAFLVIFSNDQIVHFLPYILLIGGFLLMTYEPIIGIIFSIFGLSIVISRLELGGTNLGQKTLAFIIIIFGLLLLVKIADNKAK